MLDAIVDAVEGAARGVERSGDPVEGQPVRDGLPDADLGARGRRHLERAGARARDVRPRRAPARHVRAQLPAGAAAGRARRPLHDGRAARLGPPQRHRPRAPGVVPDGRSAGGGAGQGPEAARPARRHAGDLRHRVRPHVVRAGRAEGRLRPRPPRRQLQRVDGRRRHQGRHHLRRDRRLQLQHRQGPGAHPRLQRHHPADARHRPHQADVPRAGARLPADRRRGEDRERRSWRNRPECLEACEPGSRTFRTAPGG